MGKQRPSLLAIGLATAASLAVQTPLHAQWREPFLPKEGERRVEEPASRRRPSYGTTDASFVSIPAAAFVPLNSTDGYTTTNSGYHDTVIRRPSAGSGATFFSAAVHLPDGAKVVYLELDYCDTDPAVNDIQGAFVDCDYTGVNCDATSFLTSGGIVGGDTCTATSADLSAQNIVINNSSHHYSVVSLNFNDDGSTGLSGMIVGYQLQVSPAPAAATFLDVPVGSPQHRFVEALVAAGITAGCGGGNYCPGAPVTRGQLAVFLATALGLHF